MSITDRLKQTAAGLNSGSNGSHKAATAAVERSPVLVRMSDVVAQPIDWVWRDRFVAGAINLVAGPGGIGKSTTLYDVVSRITTGDEFPDGAECQPGSCLLISGEDDPARVIRPRLDAHGADTDRVHLLRAVKQIDINGKETEVGFTLEDVDALAKAADQMDELRLIVVDPIGSFLGGRTDANTDNTVRAVLAPVNMLAEKYGCAVVCIAHHRKSAGSTADELVLGSRAFTALSRAVWHVFKDPADHERRLMLAGKCNLARAKTGLAFTIAGDPVGKIEWEPDPVPQSADEFVQDQSKPGPNPESKQEAADWLREALADGPVETNQLKKLVKEAGVSWATVRRAKVNTPFPKKDEVGVKVEKNEFSKKYQWRLLRPGEGK